MIGVFDLFKLGVGPSSSHTMGPMSAAARFLHLLRVKGLGEDVARVEVRLFGSLALTGQGHATDRAVILGLMGYEPATVDPDEADSALANLHESGRLSLGGEGHTVPFRPDECIVWERQVRIPGHPNALAFKAFRQDGASVEQLYFSIGGGFVLSEEEMRDPLTLPENKVPYPFASALELLDISRREKLSIAQLMRLNELAARSVTELDRGLDTILMAMDACIERGLRMEGVLPGRLGVRRRARSMHQALSTRGNALPRDPLAGLDWLNLWALAVNEENAAGGRVVTAPTNGAAGIIPSVLKYHTFYQEGTRGSCHDFLLTAAAIGSLYKRNASISGAEVGCQGEVGVASSMAAAGLAAAMGADSRRIENAAEIAMEHNLGLTCDPVGGLVQIPCIERNAIAAAKAVNAARLALQGDGTHHISLDVVIETMRRTGADMKDIYKETSLGGLAVSIAEC